MGRPNRHAKRGLTLIEVMLAGSLLALCVISIYEGIGLGTRIAHENAQYLVADAYAHDLAWKRFNESYSSLNNLCISRAGASIIETISSNAVPALWIPNSPPRSYTTLTWPRNSSGVEEKTGVIISVDVEWGPPGNRHRLSTSSHTASIFKSGFGQEDGS